jgi:hypothetical protein
MVNPFRPSVIHLCLAALVAALVGAVVFVETRADETQAYERAVTSLAAGHSDVTVLVGYRTLEAAGTKAFRVLIAHVKDTVKAAPGHFEEARIDQFGNIEQPTVGDVCFRLVRHEVEGDWPKGFRYYQVLTKDGVASWWNKHQTQSLHEMRLETARISLARAKKDFEKVKSQAIDSAVRFLTARLQKVEREGQQGE